MKLYFCSFKSNTRNEMKRWSVWFVSFVKLQSVVKNIAQYKSHNPVLRCCVVSVIFVKI